MAKNFTLGYLPYGSTTTATVGVGNSKTEISRPVVVNCLGLAPARAGCSLKYCYIVLVLKFYVR